MDLQKSPIKLDKMITQQTFDDVVRENVTEFDMSAEEALTDAVEQFESQGVNLNIIVKDASLYAAADENGVIPDHAVVAAVKRLDACITDVSNPSNDEVIICLQELKKECDAELSRRCLAGSNGAYLVFLKTLQAYVKDPDMLRHVLSSFCSLVNGQPDLIEQKGIELLINALKEYKDNPELETQIIRAMRLNCIKHEGNRSEFISQGIITQVTELFALYKANASMVKEICMCLRALTLDDDVRVPFGKAHDTAKTIVTEGDALRLILVLCEVHEDNDSALAELFLTLSMLTVRNEFCEEVMNRGGCKFIVGAFRKGMKDRIIVRQALIVLKALAGNDEVKKVISKLGGVELVVEGMVKHQKNAAIAEASCRLLTAITLRNPDNCRRVVEAQGHMHIIRAMELHPNVMMVQKSACMTVRNLVGRAKELIDVILGLGVEALLNQALNTHTDLADEAKAALRDLGCKVELKERWTGKMGNMQNDPSDCYSAWTKSNAQA